VAVSGDGLQVNPDGGFFVYPAHGFRASGVVGGVAVVCLSADVQALHHLGYEPKPKDRQDMETLRDRVGLALPSPYA
jgi:lincosamide nucleotidyltransferase A/C/D/E